MNENSKGGKVHSYELGKERKKEMINRNTVGRGKEREKGMINLCGVVTSSCAEPTSFKLPGPTHGYMQLFITSSICTKNELLM